MNEPCTKHGVIEEQIKTIFLRLDKTEQKTDQNTDDIHSLKENKASNDEKFDRVFELLGELKLSIDKIQLSIEKRNDRLPTALYGVVGTIIGGLAIWLITK